MPLISMQRASHTDANKPSFRRSESHRLSSVSWSIVLPDLLSSSGTVGVAVGVTNCDSGLWAEVLRLGTGYIRGNISPHAHMAHSKPVTRQKRHMATHSSIHSCFRQSIHSVVHPFTHSFVRAFVHSFIRAFINLFVHSVIHSYFHSFKHSFIHPFIRSINRPFIHTLIHAFVHSFVRAFSHTFVDSWIH